MRTGIYGGAFDPIHYGHLHVSRTALSGASLDRVIFVPSGNPPHKEKSGLTPASLRLEMLRLGLEGERRFSISEMELRSPQMGYTLDVVRKFRKQYPQDELFFIIGGDSLRDLPKWHSPNELLDEVAFITVERPNFEAEGIIDALPFSKDVKQRLRAGVIKADLLEISSSDIRYFVSQGDTIHHLVPLKVCDFIHNYNLYKR